MNQLHEYQQERLRNIREWYARCYIEQPDLPCVIKYSVLWSVFNALYNVADLPNNEIKKVKNYGGHKMPVISFSPDREKLKDIAKQLSKRADLVEQLITNHGKALEYFNSRRPHVEQPKDEIVVEIDGKVETFRVSDFKGIASIDRRVFVKDGVLFRYQPFDFELDESGKLEDEVKMMRQLVFFLYQLRNNIVHGGSAAILTEETITDHALPVLETLVDFMLEHREIVVTSGN